MAKEQLTKVKLPLSNSVRNLEGNLIGASQQLHRYLAMVPEEYRESAILNIDSGDYDGSSDIYTIHYYRPETKEEKAERLTESNLLREQQKDYAKHQIEDYRRRFPELFATPPQPKED